MENFTEKKCLKVLITHILTNKYVYIFSAERYRENGEHDDDHDDDPDDLDDKIDQDLLDHRDPANLARAASVDVALLDCLHLKIRVLTSIRRHEWCNELYQ